MTLRTRKEAKTSMRIVPRIWRLGASGTQLDDSKAEGFRTKELVKELFGQVVVVGFFSLDVNTRALGTLSDTFIFLGVAGCVWLSSAVSGTCIFLRLLDKDSIARRFLQPTCAA